MEKILKSKPSFLFSKNDIVSFDVKSYNDYISKIFNSDKLYVDIVLFDEYINKHYVDIYYINVPNEEKEGLCKHISETLSLIEEFNKKYESIEFIEINYLEKKVEIRLKLYTNIKIIKK